MLEENKYYSKSFLDYLNLELKDVSLNKKIFKIKTSNVKNDFINDFIFFTKDSYAKNNPDFLVVDNCSYELKKNSSELKSFKSFLELKEKSLVPEPDALFVWINDELQSDNSVAIDIIKNFILFLKEVKNLNRANVSFIDKDNSPIKTASILYELLSNKGRFNNNLKYSGDTIVMSFIYKFIEKYQNNVKLKDCVLEFIDLISLLDVNFASKSKFFDNFFKENQKYVDVDVFIRMSTRMIDSHYSQALKKLNLNILTEMKKHSEKFLSHTIELIDLELGAKSFYSSNFQNAFLPKNFFDFMIGTKILNVKDFVKDKDVKKKFIDFIIKNYDDDYFKLLFDNIGCFDASDFSNFSEKDKNNNLLLKMLINNQFKEIIDLMEIFDDLDFCNRNKKGVNILEYVSEKKKYKDLAPNLVSLINKKYLESNVSNAGQNKKIKI